MKEIKDDLMYIEKLREKLGVSPKKCIYNIVKGEIIIYRINERKKCLI